MTDRAWHCCRTLRFAASLAVAALSIPGPSLVATAAEPATAACPDNNAGILLPPGFCATVFADNLGHVRHLVVAPDGVVYVNTWSGVYYRTKPPPGGFVVALKDTKGDGHADVIRRFGDSVEQGSAGGTGIALYQNALYVEQNDRILRYRLTPGSPVPSAAPAGHRLGTAAHRRSSDASVCDRCARQAVRRPRLGDQCLRRAQPHAAVAGQRSVHRAADARRHLALRRHPHRPEILARRALRDRHPQRRGSVVRCRRPALRHAARTRSAQRELAGSLQRPSRATSCRPRSCCCWSREPTTAGPNATSTAFSSDWCWRRNTAATAGTPSACAAGKRAPIAFFPAHWAPDDLLIYTGAAVSCAVPRRRVHRVSRLVEPRALATGRLQRRIPAAGRRQGDRRLHRVRGRLRRRGEGAGPRRLPAHGPGAGARRRAVRVR